MCIRDRCVNIYRCLKFILCENTVYISWKQYILIKWSGFCSLILLCFKSLNCRRSLLVCARNREEDLNFLLCLGLEQLQLLLACLLELPFVSEVDRLGSTLGDMYLILKRERYCDSVMTQRQCVVLSFLFIVFTL